MLEGAVSKPLAARKLAAENRRGIGARPTGARESNHHHERRAGEVALLRMPAHPKGQGIL